MKFGYASWLPETSFISTFIEGLRNNKLMGTKCKGCGAKYLPPRSHCKCGSNEIEWFEAPTLGRILTYTIIMHPPEGMSEKSPYTIAIAELEDGSRILAQLTDGAPKTVKAGMQIEVTSARILPNRIVYAFRPV